MAISEEMKNFIHKKYNLVVYICAHFTALSWGLCYFCGKVDVSVKRKTKLRWLSVSVSMVPNYELLQTYELFMVCIEDDDLQLNEHAR